MKTKIVYLWSILLLICSFTACSNKAAVPAPGKKLSANKSNMVSASRFSSMDMVMEEAAVFENDLAVGNENIYERKLIKNGDISIQVNDLSETEAAVNFWVGKYNGYISNQSLNQYSGWYSVKIPCEYFEQAMNDCGEFGTVLSHSVSTDDVSEQYYDLESRIATKKIMYENLKSYLSKAQNVTDMLTIERELNNVISELESLEGRMNRLSNQISYSTINVNFRLPDGQSDGTVYEPGFKENFMDFLRGLGDFFGGLVIVLCYIVAWGVPIVLVAAFLFWLLFGKVGLLKKLFKKLK